MEYNTKLPGCYFMVS